MFGIRIAVLAAVLAAPLFPAQDKKDQTVPPLQHEVTVTATRVPTPPREVASALTVIGRTEIERSARSSVLDLIQDGLGAAAVRNGGTLYQPQLVHHIAPPIGAPTYQFAPRVTGHLPVTAEQLALIQEGLRGVTTLPGGTARHRFLNIEIPVAGKTGTAKRHNPNGRGYLNNSYTVSFVGMLPAQNPAFVCVVVIDDPRTDKVTRYGGTIAAPAFGRIAARAAAYMNLRPTEPIPHALATTAATAPRG